MKVSSSVLHFSQYSDSGSPVSVKLAHQSGIETHSHDFFELVYVQSGFSLHENVKSATLLVEGDLFLVPPGATHRYVGPHTVDIYNCLFIPEALSGYEKDIDDLPALKNLLSPKDNSMICKVHLDLDEQKSVSRFLKNMIYESTNTLPGWQVRMKCTLICILIEFARAFEKHIAPASDKPLYPNYVAKAIGLINERYSDPSLSVSLIALEAGVTPDYLSRQFKAFTGVGVQEYLRRYRFAKATERLSGGETVGEVAFGVGFSSLAHFSREFKKEMGVTPTAYARENSY